MTRVSVLEITDVQLEDYGDYDCAATNRLGSDSHTVELVLPSVPDPPLDLRVLNASSETVSLGWTPGFDGGFSQTFRVRYAPVRQPAPEQHVHVPHGTYEATVRRLRGGTRYRFSVSAHNRLGESRSSLHQVSSTGTERPASARDPTRTPAGSLLGSALLLLNCLLVVCYIRRRRSRQDSEFSSGALDASSEAGSCVTADLLPWSGPGLASLNVSVVLAPDLTVVLRWCEPLIA
ncbi:nephrin-like [Pollicipes pollicipes]|uniref:nephrin-like n=1 Tax=Pollicipes pollicipes TaxID=41117 RepID=UPI001885499D|nr:nephrin-like [Pollicipes pollicipes]